MPRVIESLFWALVNRDRDLVRPLSRHRPSRWMFTESWAWLSMFTYDFSFHLKITIFNYINIYMHHEEPFLFIYEECNATSYNKLTTECVLRYSSNQFRSVPRRREMREGYKRKYNGNTWYNLLLKLQNRPYVHNSSKEDDDKWTSETYYPPLEQWISLGTLLTWL